MIVEHTVREQTLLISLLAAHSAAILLWVAGTASRRKALVTASVWTFAAAFALNGVLIVDRWLEAGRAPFKTLYETLLFYPWCVGVATLILLALHRLRVLIPFSSAACIAGLAYAMAKPDVEIVNLPPALQSAWFVPHVVTYFIAYGALFLSFVLAVLAIARPAWRSEETGKGFEEHAHGAVMFGFTALTLGVVMGAVWGKEAWGDYWTWDPKENWALVSWLAYLVYLHVRMVRGWTGRRAMAVCASSFAAVVFTYLGMSLLPTASESLHVYQQP
ncbi:MAG: cytochrome c biogenesis protein CcsA [Planctomycetes bacterium]|nr:cytochrome c biogenesis protein CcsA [Planctomycetota bacterium]